MSIAEQIEKLNPYTARVDRTHPTAFIFLIDQSGSMEEQVSIDGKRIAKKDVVADTMNRQLDEMLNRCTKPEEVRHYFDIAIIGYGARSSEANYISFGDYGKEGWLTPEDLKTYARHQKKTIEQNIRGVVKSKEVDVPYWLEPASVSRTPMRSAFQLAKKLLADWCESKVGKDCYPPVLINITDGIQTDAEDDEMIAIAKDIMQLGTIDGKVLLFNIHLNAKDELSVAFPTSAQAVGDDRHSQMLYEMSSTLPNIYKKDIEKMLNTTVEGQCKAMGYNQDVHFVQMLNIGTITNMSDDYE